MDNLRIVFPEKTDSERKNIAKQFYKNFADSFMETVKLLSAGERFMLRHFVLDNPEMYEQFFDRGRKCHLHLGHIFNWEMANLAMPSRMKYKFIVAYMPIESKVVNRLFKHLRTRTGSVLLPATQMSRSIVPYRNSLYMLVLVADQAPGSPSSAYWLPFFGYPTPFVKGPERGARVANIPVLFPHFYKTKRGYYRAKLELVADEPAELPEGELTRRYVDFLERNIREQPALWLWSHRRFKHEWKEEYESLWIGKEPAQKI